MLTDPDNLYWLYGCLCVGKVGSDWKKKVLSRFIVFSMYFSAGMLPVYLNIMDLGLNRTFWVYLLPYAVNVYEMILIRTFIQGQPKALEESAVLDGANDLKSLLKSYVLYARRY